MLCLLVAPIVNAGPQDLAFESFSGPIVSVSEFLPVTLNVDIPACLVPDELLGPLVDELGFHQGSEGSQEAE